MVPLTRKELFIKKANLVHNLLYDYSKVCYVNNRTNVEIICSIHGNFYQTPDKHINRGDGCPKCSKFYKSNIDDFIKKAISKYNDLFDYTRTVYINAQTKVFINCKKHGIFQEMPYRHLNANTCPGCKREKRYEEFIAKSRNSHGDKFIYDKVNYVNCYEKVEIICRIHGVFLQAPHSHIQGIGCPKCDKSYHDKDNSSHQFVGICKNIHNDRYDYSDVEYKNKRIKVSIKCHKHGVFKQLPSNHKSGRGCPVCRLSKGENRIYNFLKGNGLSFEVQKKLHGNFKYDFYIASHNVCIEYDGHQHFSLVEYFGGLPKLIEIINNDFLKDKYCHINDIHLIRIPYWEYENIECVLIKALNKIGIYTS